MKNNIRKIFEPRKIDREKRKRKPRKTCAYCERYDGFSVKITHVCRECHFTAKVSHMRDCPNCHAKNSMVNVGLTARPPRKNASKKKWKYFWEVIVPNSHPRGCR